MAEILTIILSYLIGSIPFSYLIARIKGVDLRKKVQDGQIGAAAVKKNWGLFPALSAGSLDFSKGALVIFIAKKLTRQDWLIVLSGLAAIIGHNWSIFLKFWGGKGALVSFGALFYLLTIPFLFSLLLIIPFFLIKGKEIFGIRKTSFFTGLGYTSLSFLGFFYRLPFIYSLSPLIFSLPMIFKKN